MWDKLGYVEGLLGHYDKALTAHQHAIDILANLFGEQDARLAVAISNRGLAEEGLGDYGAAMCSHQKAHDLLINAFGGDHKLTKLVSSRLSQIPS